MSNDIETKFAAVLRDVAKVDPSNLNRDKRLREDLGIDSLALIDIAVAAEDAFGVLIPDEALERAQTVGDVVDLLSRAKVPA